MFHSAYRTSPQPSRKDQAMNPEKVLEEVAIAIKHRCISNTHRWYCVYYYGRICCVPSHVNVPPEIILCEFTENMVQKGFSVIQWNQCKQNIIKLYKELEP